jgi:23S rRNA pseudoU1915 N3-methylase RlmH
MITLITVSDTWNHFRKAIEEYRHRLPKSVQYITIAPERSTERRRIIARETERIIDALKKVRGRAYLCDETGRTYTTRAFHTFLMREIQE